ncbi:MAG TPA: hypothetical protein VMV15_07860 [Candidatus Binataceae bacterium]|nr:hypothetical protein [Candidatus Binataceae bacterium]
MRRRRLNVLAQWLPGNFTILLCVLLAVILIPPFFKAEQGDRLIIPLLLCGVVLLTLKLFAPRRNQFLDGHALAIPSSPPARAVAAVEGIAGQFYIAVLIARLVSLHSSRWGSE